MALPSGEEALHLARAFLRIYHAAPDEGGREALSEALSWQTGCSLESARRVLYASNFGAIVNLLNPRPPPTENTLTLWDHILES